MCLACHARILSAHVGFIFCKSSKGVAVGARDTLAYKFIFSSSDNTSLSLAHMAAFSLKVKCD